MLSSKKYILQYIILKILNNDYVKDVPAPSENRLAMKFNCSRLTARSALIILVNIGVLVAKQGMGYLVSEKAMDILFFAKKLNIDAHKTKIEIIDKLEIESFTNLSITGLVDIYYLRNYDALDNLLSVTYFLINKTFARLYNDSFYDFSKNPIEELIAISIVPSQINTDFIISNVNSHNQDMKELKYDATMPIPLVLQEWVDTNGIWMVKTINIVTKGTYLFGTTIYF